MKKQLHVLLGSFLFLQASLAAELPEVFDRVGSQTAKENIMGDRQTNQIAFIENKGQIVDQGGKPNPEVKYLLAGPGLNVQLNHKGFSYDTWVTEPGKVVKLYHRIDIQLQGANPSPQIITAAPLKEVKHITNSAGSFNNIRQFEVVTYKEIYPGIDLEFVAKNQNDKPFEYNFIVHPGADPTKIRLKYIGANSTKLSDDRIKIGLRHGNLSENIPASWLEQPYTPVHVQYKGLGNDTYAFNIPDYNQQKTLIIDPTPNLEWATYFGGSGDDLMGSIDRDPEGNIYLSGTTASSNNIASSGAAQGTFGGGDNDMFLVKFNAAGQRLWSTYLGGSGNDQNFGVTYHNGNVYIGGSSQSPGLATTGAHQTALVEGRAAGLISRFDANTGARNWTTYYGGRKEVYISRIAIDGSGNIFAFGSARPSVYPDLTDEPGDVATPGAFRTTPRYVTSVLVKFNAAGTRQWGTYIVGGQLNTYAAGIAIDAAGDLYVSGSVMAPAATGNTGDPLAGTLVANVGEGTEIAGQNDGFLAKFSGGNGSRLWGRFFGGTSNDYIKDLEFDPTAGKLYVVGYSNSGTGIASAGAYRPTRQALQDGFWASFSTNGQFQYGTYLGSQAGTLATAMSLRLDSGSLLILGNSNTTGGELASDCSYQPMPNGASDSYINRFDVNTGQRIWGTYFGGTSTEAVYSAGQRMLVPTGNGGFALGIGTQSANLAVAGAHQSTHGGGTYDVILAKFNNAGLPSNLAVSPSIVSPMSQTACILGIPGVITGNAIGVTAPAGYNTKIFYQWQKSSSETGLWENIPGEVFKDLQPPASQTTTYYRRLVRVNADYCNQATIDSSQAASVVINANVSPIANADGPQWFVCGPGSNTVTLNGTASGGTSGYTYQWFEGSTSGGTPLANTASWTTSAVTRATTYTLQVRDAAGCVDLDQVTVAPAVANAGQDQGVCQGAGGIQLGTAPVASPSVTYNWSVVSGAPISTLSCTSCAQPVANPAVVTVYRLTVTVQQKNGSSCTTTDDVTVTPVTAPNGTLAFAGTDKTICKNTTVSLGEAADNTFAYTWTPGQYLSASHVANPVFSAGTAAVTGGSINYTATAVKDGCTFTDEVKVSAINSRITSQDERKCGPLWSMHMDEDNAPGTTYTWSMVSGNGTVLQTINNGRSAYLKSNSGVTRFRRTTTLNGVSCTADIEVESCSGGSTCDFDIVTLSGQGCPKVFGPAGLKLGTSFTAHSDYNFSWSPANLVDNPNAATVNITSTAPATITVTVTNKYDASIRCTESIEINPPGWSLPTFTAEDKNICPNTSIQIGSTPVAGFEYAWLPSANLSAADAANPIASVPTTTEFSVNITETATGCTYRDSLTVNVLRTPESIAGNDRAVCNGATVTLGSPAPVGTNWTYSWEPANAAWTNGTGPNDPQPQIQFAFASSQSFILTVTDPLTGCMDKDTVVLRNTMVAGEYAGTPVATCQGTAVQLGREAEPFAQYQWFMADGVTPATGLSCTNCANPTVTNPTTTTTYTVKVSYPGCNTPMSDQVTLTVNPVNSVNLIDKTVCPAGPIAIGFGATGNPGAPAGASYSWTPATGLSSTTVANPTATVTAEVTYTVTVTLPGGCTFTDQVKVTPSANAGSDATLCLGESTMIGTPALAGATYSWTGAGIVSAANVAQPTVKPTATTTYTVSVTLNGCTTTDQVVVAVNTPADFAITGNSAICEGGVATLTLAGTPASGTTWQWSPVTGVSNPTGTSTMIATTSTQTFRLTQTNLATGCSNYKEVVVVVSPNTIAATVSDVALCEGISATLPLNVTSSGNYSYVWSPSVGLSNAFVANPTVLTGSPRTYNVVVTDNISQCQLAKQVNVTINAPEACYEPVSLSGNVFHDANALKDVTVNSTSNNPIPGNLYVTLVNSLGVAIKTVPVNGNGTYDFGITNPGDYSIILNQTSTGSTTPSLPAGWVNTGENLGAGVGSDDAVSGILTGVRVAEANVTNANFGIQQPPLAEPKIYVIDQPSVGQEIFLNGTHVSTNPGTSSPGQMTGTDPEDGVLNGNGKNQTVVITTLADHGELWYNGVLVKTGQVIPNYDLDLMLIKLTGSGYTNITYEYAYIDQAGAQSPPVTYKISWGSPLPVTLVDFAATTVENSVLLNWETTEETNSDRFEIERTQDGKSWITIGKVMANGESTIARRYFFTDDVPVDGDNYYRLKMADRDNTFTYSGIRSAVIDGKLSLMVYPNPAQEYISVDTNHNKVKAVNMASMSGVKVYSGNQANYIDVKHLTAGVYVLTLTFTDNTTRSQKVVIVK